MAVIADNLLQGSHCSHIPGSGETDVTGRISRIGDHGVRVALYEAANVILTRAVRGSDLKNWALRVAQRAGMKKAEVALARKLAVVLHRMLTDSTTFVVRQQGFGRARHQPRPDVSAGR